MPRIHLWVLLKVRISLGSKVTIGLLILCVGDGKEGQGGGSLAWLLGY